MADQKVEVQSEGDRSRVAYEMAQWIWAGNYNRPTEQNKDQFLELVADCVNALR